jgi:hypothetical protein
VSDWLHWLIALVTGYALFLGGFSVFMHFEGKKVGDNQHRIKLLPPPPRILEPHS